MMPRRISSFAMLAAAMGAIAVDTSADVPAPHGPTTREPQRRNKGEYRPRVADPERERRAAEKRARKAAKRLKHAPTEVRDA